MRPLITVAVGSLICAALAGCQAERFEWSGPIGSSKPFLAATRDGELLLTWFQLEPDSQYALRMTRRRATGWDEPVTVARGPAFFVNWADFPSITETSTGELVAHWLEKTAATPYAYHVRLARSSDGKTWSTPITAHTDRSPTEHGFVAMVPGPDGSVAVAWLDGGAMVGDSGAMAARIATLDPSGAMRDEHVLDPRTCECCQLAMARAATGLVAVYRDRSADEVRDIAIVREDSGGWTEPAIVSPDHWVWKACPVNGPSIAARGTEVVVGWFTAVDGKPKVQVAFSSDAGASFGAPVRIDEGNPVGRVHLQLLEPGRAAAIWLETEGPAGAWRVRPVTPTGAGRATTVAATTVARDAGFPRAALVGSRLYLAWTEPGAAPALSRVRIRHVAVAR